MTINKISLMIGGEAGAGITRSGFLLAKACLRGGLHVFGTNDYQSLIRGGHNFYTVRVDSEETYSQSDTIDLLLALNKETILLHKDELSSGGGIVYDETDAAVSQEELGRKDLKRFPVPLMTIVQELKGTAIMRNTVALGVAMGLVNYDLPILNEVLRETFTGKVAESNVKATQMGYRYVKKHYADDFDFQLQRRSSIGKRRILLTGSEAVGLGALRAGCKFYVAYPMTPATPVQHFLAPLDREYGMVVMHAESEIAAINIAAGAAFAGARAMTATSGGGFCLMTEGLGMAGITETPIVINVAQRHGPSTGLPTYSGQADLRFTIHASQGEFPRVVIAPGDVEECFYKTMEAFNLAEKYQIPAILLTDKYLAESHGAPVFFDENQIGVDRGLLITEDEYSEEDEYHRYRLTDTGISPRALPGMKNAIVRANADEHNEAGYTTEEPETTKKMVDKRFTKLDVLTRELESYETTKLYGSDTAEVTILGWGSTKGPIREALKLISKKKQNVNFLQIMYLNPFPVAKVTGILKSTQKTIVVECNKTSQLSSLVREHLLTTVDHAILKYDGRPFNPGELSRRIMEVL
ncbi:MAG: 2-oxoacid:acceptor oxidoreductase subunit alpha [Candidatus Bathyarchaeota archaeon]|nr:MAG: 2-oxoacid:acceptor oxidoreductase subunit alpha [Candidatus Bathyarchaeota archaeon]